MDDEEKNNMPSPNQKKPLKARAVSKDRHVKVGGRDRRVRVPLGCAKYLFELTTELKLKNHGDTVDWLLHKAEPAIIAATGHGINVITTPQENFHNPIGSSSVFNPLHGYSTGTPLSNFCANGFDNVINNYNPYAGVSGVASRPDGSSSNHISNVYASRYDNLINNCTPYAGVSSAVPNGNSTDLYGLVFPDSTKTVYDPSASYPWDNMHFMMDQMQPITEQGSMYQHPHQQALMYQQHEQPHPHPQASMYPQQEQRHPHPEASMYQQQEQALPPLELDDDVLLSLRNNNGWS